MRLFLRLLFSIPILLFFTGENGQAENNLQVEYFPKGVRQGDVCLVKGIGPESLKSIYGELQGKSFPIAFEAPEGIYQGLVGIDMNTPPATYTLKVSANDEGNRAFSRTLSVKVEKLHVGIQRLTLPLSLVDLDVKTLERVNKEAKQLEALFKAFRDERLWRGGFLPPVDGKLSSTFGLKRLMNGRRKSPHTGVDLQVAEGTPVLASNSGVTILVEELFLSGKSVILDHGWGLYSMYFHLSQTLVKEGDKVGKGTLLGRVGSTGRSTESHLHWGIRMNGARVDPLSLLKISSLLF